MNIRISILILLINTFCVSAMEEYPSGQLLHQLEEGNGAEQMVHNAIKRALAHLRDDQAKNEKEFVDLMEDPFEKSQEETLDRLSWLLTHGGINPHYERCSKYEMIGFMPIKYLSSQLTRATSAQKIRLEKMIQLMEAKK